MLKIKLFYYVIFFEVFIFIFNIGVIYYVIFSFEEIVWSVDWD